MFMFMFMFIIINSKYFGKTLISDECDIMTTDSYLMNNTRCVFNLGCIASV